MTWQKTTEKINMNLERGEKLREEGRGIEETWAGPHFKKPSYER